jgi:uncharacterized protein
MVSKPSSKPFRLLPSRPLPSYRYLPGLAPHPIRDVGGHMYGQSEPNPNEEHLCWSIDLFNEGYYWEAHEAFELLWKSLPKVNPYRWLLQSIILSAAATLKSNMGLDEPAARLHKKALQKVSQVLGSDLEFVTIIDVSNTIANIIQAAETGATPYVVVQKS